LGNRVYFIDANVPMYAVGAAHPLKAPCVAILEAVAKRELTAVTDVEVLQEILHRYTALRQRERAIEVAELFLEIVSQVLPVTKEDFLLAMQLHAQHPSFQARDALHGAVMQRHSIQHIISADRHFDGISTLTRLDPADWPF
jgi:predicted nucleic acid-binding protein